jgi:hypothetical protein
MSAAYRFLLNPLRNAPEPSPVGLGPLLWMITEYGHLTIGGRGSNLLKTVR